MCLPTVAHCNLPLIPEVLSPATKWGCLEIHTYTCMNVCTCMYCSYVSVVAYGSGVVLVSMANICHGYPIHIAAASSCNLVTLCVPLCGLCVAARADWQVNAYRCWWQLCCQWIAVVTYLAVGLPVAATVIFTDWLIENVHSHKHTNTQTHMYICMYVCWHVRLRKCNN